MKNITQILSQIESGDPNAAEQLLPLLYEELRKLAAAKLAQENPGQTLQATALVHEAYIRLVDVEEAQHWDSRGHFFAAAAEAMRRILVEQARRKARLKRGGELVRHELHEFEIVTQVKHDEIIAVDEALQKLEALTRCSSSTSEASVFCRHDYSGMCRSSWHFLSKGRSVMGLRTGLVAGRNGRGPCLVSVA